MKILVLQSAGESGMLLVYAVLFFCMGFMFFSMVLWQGGDASGSLLASLGPIGLGLYALWKHIKGSSLK